MDFRSGHIDVHGINREEYQLVRYDQETMSIFSRYQNQQVMYVHGHKDNEGVRLYRENPKENDVWQQWHVVYADQVERYISGGYRYSSSWGLGGFTTSTTTISWSGEGPPPGMIEGDGKPPMMMKSVTMKGEAPRMMKSVTMEGEAPRVMKRSTPTPTPEP